MSESTTENQFECFRRNGDAASLGRVFDDTALELHKIARRLTRDASEAADLGQATLPRTIEKPDSFDGARRPMP